MVSTPKTSTKTPRERLSDAARAYGSALEYAQHDSNPGAVASAEKLFEALVIAAEEHTVGWIAGWLHGRANQTSSLVLRRTLQRLAKEILTRPWSPVRG